MDRTAILIGLGMVASFMVGRHTVSTKKETFLAPAITDLNFGKQVVGTYAEQTPKETVTHARIENFYAESDKQPLYTTYKAEQPNQTKVASVYGPRPNLDGIEYDNTGTTGYRKYDY